MAIASVPLHPSTRFAQRRSCCLTRAHDARRLASATAAVVTPGRLLDIGCGAGGVAIHLLRARPDISVIGVEIWPAHADEAVRRATVAGVGRRLHLVVGDALAIRLPATLSAVANPPMVPGEPGFALGGTGRERLFTHALVERLADAGVRDIWLHQFDYLGVDIQYGPGPTLARAGTALGFEVSFPHRGWRALGPGSAVRRALPALGRLFPDAPARLGEALVPLAQVPVTTTASLAIRHSIVRLHRPATTQGVLQ